MRRLKISVIEKERRGDSVRNLLLSYFLHPLPPSAHIHIVKTFFIPSLPKIAILLALAGTSHAQVTLIQEDFDNYGNTAVQLSGQSGGAGFSGNWVNVGGGVYGYTNTNLTVSNTGYVNTGLTGSTSGAASNNGFSAGLNGFNSTRTITRPDAYLGVTGNTVWFSYTAQLGAVDSGNNT